MTNSYVPASDIVAYYLEAANVRDSALLEAVAWMQEFKVIEVKSRTDLAVMRYTCWWVSRMRAPVAQVKHYTDMYLQTKWRVCETVFAQNADEVRQSTPLSFYFHTISTIPDVVRLRRLSR